MPLAKSYEQARIQVEQLVDRFHRKLAACKRAEYKEEQVRVEFINPFFEALGWDVRNTKGYAEPYKDVIHEVDRPRRVHAQPAQQVSHRHRPHRREPLPAQDPSRLWPVLQRRMLAGVQREGALQGVGDRAVALYSATYACPHCRSIHHVAGGLPGMGHHRGSKRRNGLVEM